MAINTNQMAINSTVTMIGPIASRNEMTITNLTTTPIYIGDVNVTASTGDLLPGIVGASVTIPGSQAIYAIVASGTGYISIMELS